MTDESRAILDPTLHAKADRLDGRFALWAGPVEAEVEAALARLAQDRTIDAVYARDPAVWSADPAVQAVIANRLGWLAAPDAMVSELPRVRAFAEQVRAAGTTDVVLLGMGGSSLAPEVLRVVVGVRPGWPRFHMLDSTDPDAVRAVDAAVTLDHTLFVLASKSGGTIEPNSMAAYFRQRLEDAGITDWAARFVAITDEGTGLHERARREGFLSVFVNPSDIGGRYSALSLFGLVPAALMGQDVAALLDWGRAMLWLCGPARPVAANPAARLGAAMAAGARIGRDKLTLVMPPALEVFGLWVEQLVGESTGKQGRGVVPVAGETLGPVDTYGGDRLFVVLDYAASRDEARRDRMRELAAAGAPWAEVEMPEPEAIGAEFVRWELATALASAGLGVNPFDEPNVQQAKDATRRLLESRSGSGPVAQQGGGGRIGRAEVSLSGAGRTALGRRQPDQFLTLLGPGDYLAVLAYLGPDPALAEPFADLRREVRERTRCATTFGYGPRYLHSTGQLHKGGPNNGVFVIVLGDTADDVDVPGSPFTFRVLEQAQALGDFASLDATGRRAVAIRLPAQTPDAAAEVCAVLLAGLR